MNIQKWKEFELDERLEQIDSELLNLKIDAEKYYNDFSNIDQKNKLSLIVERLEDMIDSIYIFKEVYREGGLYHAQL